MEQFLLSDIHNSQEDISFLGFLATFHKDIINYDDIEKASKILYNILLNFHNKNEDNVIFTLNTFLSDIKFYNFIKIADYSFFIHDKWLLNTVLISSIRNIKSLFKNVQKHQQFLENLLNCILDNIQITEFKTAHLLRILELIVKKSTFKINNCLSILYSMQNVALSAFTNLKYHAQSISKIIISKHDLNFLVTPEIIDFLPVKGIETNSLVKLFDKSYIIKNLHRLLNKIDSLFFNNTENRDAGFIYDRIVEVLEFNDWKCLVWPFFKQNFENLEYDGEYYQSLIKYWIPISGKYFKASLYDFILTEKINLQFKGQVLLELKRKSYINVPVDIVYLNIIETRNLGLKILSTFGKKSYCITDKEFRIFLDILYSFSSIEIDEDTFISFRDFFSHFFTSGHLIVLNFSKNPENEQILNRYTSFFVVLSNFCYNNLNKDRCELAAQILGLIFEISNCPSSKLRLLYTLEKGETFEAKNNLFMIELKSTRIWKLNSSNFCEKIELCYRETDGYCPKISKLIEKFYVEQFEIFTVKNLYSLLEFNEICLQNTDKVKNFTHLLMKRLNHGENYGFIIGVTNQLKSAFNRMRNNGSSAEMIEDERQMFKIVLYLEILLIGINSVQIELIDCVLDVFNCISSFIDRSSEEKSLKNTKTLEAIINNSLQLLLRIKPENIECLINHVTKIILKSDMRRPTTLAVDILRHLLMNCSLDYQINFLDNALRNIHETPDKQLLKIRRNPESRLLIYALCSADKSTEKVLLKWTINYLVDILKNDQSANSSVAAALHTLDLLISETNLHNGTLESIPAIMEGSVEVFNRNNWTVRNADLQLTKAIIERFLGVSLTSALNNRPKSIEDLFLLFPDISVYFYSILSCPLSDKSVIIFQYFSESQHKSKLIENKDLTFVRSSFMELFVDIVKNYSEYYGNHALYAFVSLCMPNEIPEIFNSIVKFIADNSLCKNDLKNMLNILKELHLKSCFKTRIKINKEISKLSNSLRDNSKYLLYDLLSVKILTKSEICQIFLATNNFGQSNFKYRMWLNNYVPHLINTSDLTEICNNLLIIYSGNLPEFIQVKILTILISRFNRGDFKRIESIRIKIVHILTTFVLNLNVDVNNYLLQCYFNVILTFYESFNESIPLHFKLNSFNNTNIYKMFLILIFCPANCNLRSLINKMVELINSDIDSVDSLSCMLKYVFNQLENEPFHQQNYFNFFKLIFYLFLKCQHRSLIYFVNSLFKKSNSTTLQAVSCLLDYNNLLKLFKSDQKLIVSFLLHVYFHIKSLSNDFQETGTFYLSKIELPIPKKLLLKILERSLVNCYKTIK